MKAYEGNEKYIFISYAHKDSKTVLSIIEKMQNEGFRIWYDKGIEAGTEWPEYIAEHLINSAAVLVFMSNNSANSQNCRNEINYALQLKKEVLVVYLEETKLTPGMELQIGSLQSMFKFRHKTEKTFVEELASARMIQCCRGISLENLSCVTPAETARVRAEMLEVMRAEIKAEMMATMEIELKTEMLSAIEAKAEAETPAEEEEDASADGKIVYSDGTEETIKFGIKEISNRAYEHKNKITKVVLPGSVEKIGDWAFNGCEKLASITIPKNVKYIGESAFAQCKKLKAIDIPYGVTAIGDRAFSWCGSLEKIVIPDSVSKIGISTFSGCRSLASAVLPGRAVAIGYGTFYECGNLVSVTIPASVATIGLYAFANCKKLKDVYYGGSKDEWKKIKINNSSDGNVKLVGLIGRAAIHYNSK